ncbi:hypothetical protein [Bradyrhizobium iriomotense]|uniref:Uncharacterized protein n=1 Tax=Bradyrhizobium iriomotense TaxID=441950 RepID=A0ABQ6AUG1_9BRAD|nr:hypothetical protein [Bradyrhizobium iriomotense]GLR85844.1 hypothetical protein GCM10007857_25550 [Bradyrhizobium iriomotense]
MLEVLGVALIALGIVVLFVIGMRRPARPSPLLVKPPPVPLAEPELSPENALEEIERRAKAIAEHDARRRRWLRPMGVFGRLVTYAVLFLILYAYWPEDISHKPFASLTLSDLTKTAGSIAIALVLIRALFEPSDDEEIKDAWGVLGIVILGGGVVAVVLLNKG